MKSKFLNVVSVFLLSSMLFSCGGGSNSSSNSSYSNTSSQSNSQSLSSSTSNSQTNTSTSSSSSSSSVINETLEIVNKDELLQKWTCLNGGRFIEIKSNVIKNINEAVEDEKIIITSSNTNVIEVFGLYLKPLAEGTSLITINKGNLTDSVEIEIVEPDDKTPRFFLDYDGSEIYKTFINTKIKLPNYSCFDYHNNDISHLVSVTSDIDPNAKFDSSTGEFISSVKGHHNVTYSIETDGIKTSQTIPVDLYPRILADGRGGSYQISVKDELSNSPEIYSANNGIEARCFNMEPSKNYYVEAEFTKPEVAGTGSGFIHSMPNTNSGGFIREALYTGNLRTADMVKGVNFGSAGNYYTIWNASSNKRQHLGGTEGFNIDSFATEETTKLAIARRENTYYFWMNDILLEKYVSTDFNNQETIPGILCQGWKTGIDGTKAKNIYFCNEDEAINKIASLESTFAPYGYVRNDNDTYNSGSYENGILTYTTAAGQQYYNSIVGSNVLLKGNTHISFRFDATSYNVGGDDYSMFYLSKLDTGFAGDPNARTSKIASWAMVHANSYNTTVRASASQVESPWSYEKKFNGNGNEYKWDVKTWDVDIKTRIENDGSIKITYKFTEVAKANGAVSNPASYEETMTSGIKMPGSGMNTSWYGLFFQGHNKNSFTISNLVMEPLID